MKMNLFLSGVSVATCLFLFSLNALSAKEKSAVSPDAPCSCQDESGVASRFYPRLGSDIAEYADLVSVTGWSFVGGEEAFNRIFYKDYQRSSSSSGSSSFHSFTALGRTPMRVASPNRDIVINLTPCKDKTGFYKVPVSVEYREGMKDYDFSFDYKTFDGHARSYLKALMSIYRLTEKELLVYLLTRDQWNQQLIFTSVWPEIDFKKTEEAIKRINKTYGTNILLSPNESEYESIVKMLEEFEDKHVNIFDFALNEFIIHGNSQDHKMTEDEEIRFNRLFRSLGSHHVETYHIDRLIYPEVNMVFNTSYIGFIIPKDILRPWNIKQKAPLRNEQGEEMDTEILVETEALYYKKREHDYDTKLTFDVDGVCMPPAEITGTGILFSLQNVRMETENNTFNNYSYDIGGFYESDLLTIGQNGIYDLLEHFLGLYSEEASFDIPVNNKRVQGEGISVFLNSKMLLGVVRLPLESSSTPGNIVLSTSNGSKLKTTVSELEKQIKANGLTDCALIQERGELILYFKKLV